MEENFYLTKEGLERINKEYQVLKELKLSKTQGVSPSLLNLEDLNSEYLIFQEDIGFLNSRIIELENIIKNVRLIKAPRNKELIDLGATIEVEADGERDHFTIIGPLEANPTLGKISNESPVGKALIGHRVGDKVVISSAIKTIYEIKKINYFLS